MGAGRYVGRVGALAVALGVGFGVSSAVTVAVADPSSSPGSSSEVSRADARRAGVPGSSRPARSVSRPVSSAGRGPGSRSVPVPVAVADLQKTAAAASAAAMPMPAADAGDGVAVLPAAVVDLDEQLDTAALALTVAVSAAEAMPDSSAEPAVGEVPVVEEPAVPLPAPASAVAVAAPVTDVVDSSQPGGLATSPIAPLETSVAFAVLAWSRKEFETVTSPAGLAAPADPQPTTSLIVLDSAAPAPAAAAVGASQFGATPAAAAAAVEASTAAVTAAATGFPDLFGIIQSFFTGIINAIQGIFNAVAQIFGFGAPAAPVNHAPTASAPALGTPSASTGAVTVTIAASDVDGDPLSYSVSAAPAKGTLSAISNGVLTYTPTAAARSKAALSTATAADKKDTFTITVSDGAGGSVAVPVTVTVLAAAPVNHAPTASTPKLGTYNASTGAVKVTITATDADGDPLSYKVSAAPAKGTLSAITNGVLTYTPTAAARSKAALSTATAADKKDTFTITVSDGAGGTVAVPVTVTVLAAATSNQLSSGETLASGGKLVSNNGTYRLAMQTDGNLVLYKQGVATALWATGTDGKTGARAVMQGDGNLVVYQGSKAVWATGTNGQTGARLVVQDDGNLVLYKGSTAVWDRSTGVIKPPSPPASKGLSRPLTSYTIMQEYGGVHTGIDLAADPGTPVYAAGDGVIYHEGWGTSDRAGKPSDWMGLAAGISILIRHDGLGIYTGYAHLSSTVIDVGQSVTKGQLIGYVGCTTRSTGGCTGNHLHFEVLPSPLSSGVGISGRVNPRNYLSF